MALCPACGAALPATPEVLHARMELERGREANASIPGVKKAEGLWVDGIGGAGAARSGGGWLLLALLLAAAVAALLLMSGVDVIR